MRSLAFSGLLLVVICSTSPGDLTTTATNSPPTAPTPPTFDASAPAEPQVPPLHQAWQAEHDPAKRQALADQLVQAVIHEYDKQETDIVEEVARNGAPHNQIAAPAMVRSVTLDPICVLSGAHASPNRYPPSPVFRRITANRLEAWTSPEGWLFDQEGKTMADVKVPRRDGQGREWFGAFVSDGTWITTDVWGNDKQLNCYSAKAIWKWELPGAKVLAVLPKANPMPNEVGEPVTPSIGWARADKTGRRWLVCLGTDFSRSVVLVTSTGKVLPVPGDVSSWQAVYPRAMGVRGFYIALGMESDDGKFSLGRNEAGHGVEVDWPTYDLSNQWSVVIPEGDAQFGFWPRSHDVFLDSERGSRVWFFDAQDKYQGEISGFYLADAANGSDLLVQNGDQVIQVHRSEEGLAATSVRRFTWLDGSSAIPLAIYDDLKLGFFLRGSGMEGSSDDARRARAAAEIVLAKWKS